MKARSRNIIFSNFFQCFIALAKELIFVAVDNEVDEVTERLTHVVLSARSEIIEQTSGRNFCSETLNFFPSIEKIFSLDIEIFSPPYKIFRGTQWNQFHQTRSGRFPPSIIQYSI